MWPSLRAHGGLAFISDHVCQCAAPLGYLCVLHPQVLLQARALKIYRWLEDIQPHIQGTPIGDGAFGEVFKGCVGGKDVAIKIVHSPGGAPSERGIEALLQELNHCSRLQHGCNHLVQLMGLSHTSAGAICLVYEYATSGTLELVPESIDLPGALRLYAQAGRGVQHMHEAGVVHADLKPDNILLHRDESGGVRAVVADLGLASLLDPTTLSVSGLKGTRGFTAPERVGRAGVTSAASDVFAFGATMGCSVSGQTPEYITSRACIVQRTDVQQVSRRNAFEEVAAAIATEFSQNDAEGKVIRAVCAKSELVKKLVHLILKCCSVSADARPTMAEVVTSLESIAEME